MRRCPTCGWHWMPKPPIWNLVGRLLWMTRCRFLDYEPPPVFEGDLKCTVNGGELLQSVETLNWRLPPHG